MLRWTAARDRTCPRPCSPVRTGRAARCGACGGDVVSHGVCKLVFVGAIVAVDGDNGDAVLVHLHAGVGRTSDKDGGLNGSSISVLAYGHIYTLNIKCYLGGLDAALATRLHGEGVVRLRPGVMAVVSHGVVETVETPGRPRNLLPRLVTGPIIWCGGPRLNTFSHLS